MDRATYVRMGVGGAALLALVLAGRLHLSGLRDDDSGAAVEAPPERRLVSEAVAERLGGAE